MLSTLIAFVVALGVLVTVHEWGHYRVAVAHGVRVIRFSVGMGKVLVRWKPRRQHPGQDTEFVIGAFPIGGYVKMLDEREGAVAPEERHRAFNTQPLRARALIVAAGPVANLLLAVALYALVGWIGTDEPRAVLSPPVAGSLAEKAGLQSGDVVQAAALGGGPFKRIRSFEDLRWILTRGALDGFEVTLQVAGSNGAARPVRLPLAALPSKEPNLQMFRDIGIVSPLSLPSLGEVFADGAGARAGLKAGDQVLGVDEIAVTDGAGLRELIRASVTADGQGMERAWRLQRDGRELTIRVKPDAVADAQGQTIGRIGAQVGALPEMTLVRYGPLEGLAYGARRVWDISTLTLRLLGRMVVGEVSLKNLSGPIAIADYAGQSANLGPTYFLAFLAFISVSLGVLNLLPVPVLDGGHLMYYLWEGLTGRPVSEAWLQRLQYVGVCLLLCLMAIAMYNDVVARWG
ncbi:MAG: RIP metalloprotease RseP [Burkholderiaceae bacterium]|nr:RIP metalloprotease RseP [Burkholderiaceae bacterium]